MAANTLPARQARRRKRQERGDIESLRVTLWRLISRLQAELDAAPSIDDDQRKSGHLLIQAAGIYIKTVEAGEIAERLEKLEAQHQDMAA